MEIIMKHSKHWSSWIRKNKWRIVLSLVILLFLIGITLFLITPSVAELKDHVPVSFTTKDSTIFYHPSKSISLDKTPELIKKTIIEYEDNTFYTHPGISVKGILRSIKLNIRDRALTHGGSTLTQQLARNIYLTPDKNIVRKTKEAVLALKIEFLYSKDEILEFYINDILIVADPPPNKRGFYGLETGSYYYFNKSLTDLNIAETAFLIGQIRGPSVYSPEKSITKALKRKDKILRFMLNKDLITPEEYIEAMGAKLELIKPTNNHPS